MTSDARPSVDAASLPRARGNVEAGVPRRCSERPRRRSHPVPPVRETPREHRARLLDDLDSLLVNPDTALSENSYTRAET